MKKELRKEQIRKRKNFLPTLIITIILWAITFGIIYFIDPEMMLAIPIFFLCIFLSLLFTFSIIFVNSRTGLLTTSGLTLFLILRYFGIGNILNFLLLTGLLVTAEIYFRRRN